MTLDTLLARLQGARRSGNGWMARCPAHADKSPSLSMRDENGRVLLHCFAGCAVEDICAALGITVSELFANRRKAPKPEPPILRNVQMQLNGLRGRLTPGDRGRAVTVILADETSLDAAITRALALAVEGELVQVASDGEGQ